MTTMTTRHGTICVAEHRPESPCMKGKRYVMFWDADCERKYADMETVGDVTIRQATVEEQAYWWGTVDGNDRNIIILPPAHVRP